MQIQLIRHRMRHLTRVFNCLLADFFLLKKNKIEEYGNYGMTIIAEIHLSFCVLASSADVMDPDQARQNRHNSIESSHKRRFNVKIYNDVTFTVRNTMRNVMYTQTDMGNT